MKLSTKGRYGLKAMFELALNYGQGPISLNIIAEKHNISVHYLEQLIAVLRKSGLVKSVRGAQGGYMLADKPENITVGDVIRTLEGPVAPSECVLESEENECSKAEHCVTRLIWEKIKNSVNGVMDSITLENMVDDYKKMSKSNTFMYHI